MNFNQITQQFETSLPGTDAFLAVKLGTRTLMESDSGHAAAYFLVHVFARNYVILHDDEPITPDFAQASKAQLLKYMRAIDAALGQGEAALMAAMNQMVADYNASSRPF
jgi:hypothetical protein